MVVFHYLIHVHPVHQMFFLDGEVGDIIGCVSAVSEHERRHKNKGWF